MVTAILLAAGNSSRYGKEYNKIFEKINGKEIIEYSINVFDENERIDEIIIAVRESDKEKLQKIIDENKIKTKTKIVVGGQERRNSVYNAITQTNSETVIIHDAARPLIKQRYIEECIEQMKQYKGTSVGVKSKDTIKIVNEKNEVEETTKRANTWCVQTPQCFDRKTLIELHNKMDSEEEITDDCSILERYGYNISLIEGDYTNIKLTTPFDKNVIETLINKIDTNIE